MSLGSKATTGGGSLVETNSECSEELTDEFKAQIKKSLLEWMVDDAKKAAASKAYVGGLIFGVCALDVLGGLHAGVKQTSAETFKQFIEKYVPNHDAYLRRKVYRNMRSSLVHAYSTKKFKYTSDYPERHLEKDMEDGKLWVHVDSFIGEVEYATNSYLEDLFKSPELWRSFKKKWSYDPLLKPIPD